MVLYSQQLCCECVCHTNDKLTHDALHMCECMAADFIGMRRCRRANQFDSPTVIRIFSWYMCHTHLKIQKKISISLISVSLYLTDLNIKYFFAYTFKSTLSIILWGPRYRFTHFSGISSILLNHRMFAIPCNIINWKSTMKWTILWRSDLL